MPLLFIRNDITKVQCDAIVNAANESLLGGGGVDGAIHKAAGPGLLTECRTLGGCKTGAAKRTAGYDLPCRYVIHTVGPVWRGGGHGEEKLLRSCYRESLRLAAEANCESVAFPLVSGGIYGYPKGDALRVAVDEITAFLLTHEMTVYMVFYDRSSFEIGEKLRSDIAVFIGDEDVVPPDCNRRKAALFAGNANMAPPAMMQQIKPLPAEEDAVACDACIAEMKTETQISEELRKLLEQRDESFSEMLLRKIDERGMTDPQCYKKANVDRKLFSKIRAAGDYKPSKQTALAFAIALELPLPETAELLRKAGYAFSDSRFDRIVKYFISCGNYDIFALNEALFYYDQPLLGA